MADAFIGDYVERLPPDCFEKKVSRKSSDGVLMERVAWKALVHFFNHQTHHRGQVSSILDELGIENDYSNMVFLE